MIEMTARSDLADSYFIENIFTFYVCDMWLSYLSVLRVMH
jgi:hypothetical protein